MSEMIDFKVKLLIFVAKIECLHVNYLNFYE